MKLEVIDEEKASFLYCLFISFHRSSGKIVENIFQYDILQ